MKARMEVRSTLAAAHRPSGSEHPTTGDLRVVQRRFEVLQGQLELLGRLGERIRGRREWTDDLERHWEKQRDQILDEMTMLSWRAECTRADHAEEWRAKAHILLDWCVTDDNDIVHCLAASLGRDLCGISSADRPKLRGKSADNLIPKVNSES